MILNFHDYPTKLFRNTKCYRLIPSKFPPIALFDDVADPDQFDALYAIQALTNPRLQDEMGNLTLLNKEEKIYGIKGAGYVMAAFTHTNPEGSRFSDGTFGIYYASLDLVTAIKETIYHREKFLAATAEPAQRIDMRCLTAIINGEFIDLCNKKKFEHYYYQDNYKDSQFFGINAKTEQHNGIYYYSLRSDHGNNLAILRPKVIKECLQQSHYSYIWNGQKITNAYKKEFFKI